MNHFEGTIRLEFRDSANAICAHFIPNFDPARFEPIALRLFGGEETVLTIYALDKHHRGTPPEPGRVSTRKFKIVIDSPRRLFELLSTFNFTASAEGHNIDEIEVINK